MTVKQLVVFTPLDFNLLISPLKSGTFVFKGALFFRTEKVNSDRIVQINAFPNTSDYSDDV